MFVWAGCDGSPSEPVDGDADADADADSDTDTDTDTYIGHSWHSGLLHSAARHSAGPTGDTGNVAPYFDCSSVPQRPTDAQPVNGARGYHDVAMTQDGYLLGLDSVGNLIRARYMQPGSPLVPNLGLAQGMDWLPNGDLAVMRDTNSTVSRVNPSTGAMSVITNGVVGYGIVTGPDGQLYAADYDRILRIDPATGAKTTLLNPARVQPRVLNFSPDFSKLYIGTLSGNGNLFFVDLDASLNPVGDLQIFATGVGSGSYHDSLAVDYCGNLYVADYSTQAMYQIDPLGNTHLYANLAQNGNYGHGAKFGNGVGGYRLDALYLPQPYHGNTVLELVTEVPSRSWDGTPF